MVRGGYCGRRVSRPQQRMRSAKWTHSRTLPPSAPPPRLPEEDVKLGVLDLSEAGLVKVLRGMMGLDCFWPDTGLFVEFDHHFLGLDSRRDAIAVANWLVSQKIDGINITELAPYFSDWSVRRLNSALNYLDNAKLIDPLKAIDSNPWTMHCLHVTDHTRRFVRDHG